MFWLPLVFPKFYLLCARTKKAAFMGWNGIVLLFTSHSRDQLRKPEKAESGAEWNAYSPRPPLLMSTTSLSSCRHCDIIHLCSAPPHLWIPVFLPPSPLTHSSAFLIPSPRGSSSARAATAGAQLVKPHHRRRGASPSWGGSDREGRGGESRAARHLVGRTVERGRRAVGKAKIVGRLWTTVDDCGNSCGVPGVEQFW